MEILYHTWYLEIPRPKLFIFWKQSAPVSVNFLQIVEASFSLVITFFTTLSGGTLFSSYLHRSWSEVILTFSDDIFIVLNYAVCDDIVMKHKVTLNTYLPTLFWFKILNDGNFFVIRYYWPVLRSRSHLELPLLGWSWRRFFVCRLWLHLFVKQERKAYLLWLNMT